MPTITITLDFDSPDALRAFAKALFLAAYEPCAFRAPRANSCPPIPGASSIDMEVIRAASLEPEWATILAHWPWPSPVRARAILAAIPSMPLKVAESWRRIVPRGTAKALTIALRLLPGVSEGEDAKGFATWVKTDPPASNSGLAQIVTTIDAHASPPAALPEAPDEPCPCQACSPPA